VPGFDLLKIPALVIVPHNGIERSKCIKFCLAVIRFYVLHWMVVELTCIAPSWCTKFGLCADQKVHTNKYGSATHRWWKIVWLLLQRKICYAMSYHNKHMTFVLSISMPFPGPAVSNRASNRIMHLAPHPLLPEYPIEYLLENGYDRPCIGTAF
jgi:hypothetical protein